jgi:hypothetical protein
MNDFSEVPQVWQYKDSQGLQANALAVASGWHLSPFVRSLQLAFYGLCAARNLQSSQETPAAKENFKLR